MLNSSREVKVIRFLGYRSQVLDHGQTPVFTAQSRELEAEVDYWAAWHPPQKPVGLRIVFSSNDRGRDTTDGSIIEGELTEIKLIIS